MGVIMENSSSSMLFLRRNLISPFLILADKSFISLSKKSRLLHLLRQVIVSGFYVVLQVVHLFLVRLPSNFGTGTNRYCPIRVDDNLLVRTHASNARVGDTGIARAINQLLTLVNGVPVSSRKYEMVRCLAEKLIDDNLREGLEALREVNCVVLSEAFSRTLIGLENELLGQGNDVGFGLGRVVSLVKGLGGVNKESGGPGGVDSVFAEKMAAELLWLAQKLVANGGGGVAVEKWASASNLGWLALSTDPRVQASLVKVTAFLVKQTSEQGKDSEAEHGEEREHRKQTSMKMVTTWSPLLCQASNGTDVPTLSISERGDVERALEAIIDMLQNEECQEQVLSVWIHHYTQSPSSDWPNLYDSYIKWSTISRNLFVTR